MSLLGWLFGARRRRRKKRAPFTRKIKSKHRGGKASRVYVRRARASAQLKAARRSARRTRKIQYRDWLDSDPYDLFR